MRFHNKIAVVTGADSGIGRATALRLLEEGALVTAVDLRHSEPWPAEYAGNVTTLTADVADPDAPATITDSVGAAHGRLDILVNAAGILKIAPMLEVTRADWDRILSVNLGGVFFLCQAAAALMVKAGVRGRIVNVSSVHAVVSEPDAAPYTASKGGLEAMTRTMASELAAHGITVNAVRPGATWSGMSRPIYTPEVLAALSDKIPLGEVAQPEWVAAAICYLASDEARYTTGAALDVDGGYSMDGSLPGRRYQ
jgi:NAD(P)-dependent dehydrogenase (short-subunit alcohol dehydrogenase family)